MPASVTYNSFSSSENARPLGRVKPSAMASTMPDPGAIRYIWFCTRDGAVSFYQNVVGAVEWHAEPVVGDDCGVQPLEIQAPDVAALLSLPVLADQEVAVQVERHPAGYVCCRSKPLLVAGVE